jgi:hypothetical protein
LFLSRAEERFCDHLHFVKKHHPRSLSCKSAKVAIGETLPHSGTLRTDGNLIIQTEPRSHIFPTLQRDKHAETVGFPVGAESLSRALDGVPQHTLIGCQFFAGDLHRRALKPQEFVLHVSYRKQKQNRFSAHSAEANGVFKPAWTITVFALPSTMLQPVRIMLLPLLQGKAKQWLSTMAQVEGRIGQCALKITLDVAASRLVIEHDEDLEPMRS